MKLLVWILLLVLFLGMSRRKEGYSNNNYIAIETPTDWNKHKPALCSEESLLYGECLKYLMFIEDTSTYSDAVITINKEAGINEDELGNTCGIYYLKNSTPDMKRYIENNWSKPSRHPHVNVVFKKKGDQWDSV